MQLENINESYFLKQNDTSTEIHLQVLDDFDQPFPLDTALNIDVVIGNETGRQLVKIPTLLEGVVGGLSFTLDEGDILNIGDNRLEVHIYDAENSKHVAPSKGFYKLRIQQSLDSLGEVVSTFTLDYFLAEVNTILQDIPQQAEIVRDAADRAPALLEKTTIAGQLESKSAYDNAVAYLKNNLVEFNGSTFIALQDTEGNRPPLLDSEGSQNDYWKLAARKGDDGDATATRYPESFVAEANQRVFTLQHEYDQYAGRIDVFVEGILQKDSYIESSSTTITFKQTLPAGTNVDVKYFGKAVPLGTDVEETLANHSATIGNLAVAYLDDIDAGMFGEPSTEPTIDAGTF